MSSGQGEGRAQTTFSQFLIGGKARTLRKWHDLGRFQSQRYSPIGEGNHTCVLTGMNSVSGRTCCLLSCTSLYDVEQVIRPYLHLLLLLLLCLSNTYYPNTHNSSDKFALITLHALTWKRPGAEVIPVERRVAHPLRIFSRPLVGLCPLAEKMSGRPDALT